MKNYLEFEKEIKALEEEIDKLKILLVLRVYLKLIQKKFKILKMKLMKIENYLFKFK